MPTTPPVKIPRPSKVIYLGVDRCDRLRRCAVEVSYHSGQNVSAAQFTQYLIDNFYKKAISALIEEIAKSKGKSSCIPTNSLRQDKK
ncbi:hypothetical protein FVB86_21505 [Salmonella enterica]|nr:hypothetical protein [Salmonella enterica]